MTSPSRTPSGSFPKTLLWLGLVVAAGVIGYRLGQSSSGSRATVTPASPVLPPATHERIAVSSRGETAATSGGAGAANHVDVEDDWRAAHALPDNAARDHLLAERIERLARSDPRRALALVAAEKSWRVREVLRDACVRGWASVAPDAAGDWVLALRPDERHGATSALFEGAAQQPDKAVALTAHLIAADPTSASEYGHIAIDALGRAGAFQTATALAAQLATTDASLLTTAYLQWGERNPDAALASMQTLADPTARRSALEGVMNGWASADPEQLARRAFEFPSEDRTVALSAALSRWAERDPVAAAAWIEANDPGKEADDGIVTVSLQSSLAISSPETALRWAGLIIDRSKRTNAQQAILTQWASRSPAAARQYAESLSNPDDRSAALAILATSH
jgi:hypothetical protein